MVLIAFWPPKQICHALADSPGPCLTSATSCSPPTHDRQANNNNTSNTAAARAGLQHEARGFQNCDVRKCRPCTSLATLAHLSSTEKQHIPCWATHAHFTNISSAIYISNGWPSPQVAAGGLATAMTRHESQKHGLACALLDLIPVQLWWVGSAAGHAGHHHLAIHMYRFLQGCTRPALSLTRSASLDSQ